MADFAVFSTGTPVLDAPVTAVSRTVSGKVNGKAAEAVQNVRLAAGAIHLVVLWINGIWAEARCALPVFAITVERFIAR